MRECVVYWYSIQPRMRYFKGWTILDEACMRTTRWEMSEGLVDNTHWRKVDVSILMQEGKSGVWLPEN